MTSGNSVVRRKSRLLRPQVVDNRLNADGPRRPDDRPRLDGQTWDSPLRLRDPVNVDARRNVDDRLITADRLRVDHPRNADGLRTADDLSIVDDRLRVDHQPNRESNEPIVVVQSDRNARNPRLKPNV